MSSGHVLALVLGAALLLGVGLDSVELVGIVLAVTAYGLQVWHA